MTAIAVRGWSGATKLPDSVRIKRAVVRSDSGQRSWAPYAASAPPAKVSAVTDTVRQIAALDRSDDYACLSPRTRLRIIQFVQAIAPGSQVPPAILPDEDGVGVLHWVSAEHSLVIEVDESGPILLWTQSGSREPRTIRGLWEITEEARRLVDSYTRLAASTNPQWRSVFGH